MKYRKRPIGEMTGQMGVGGSVYLVGRVGGTQVLILPDPRRPGYYTVHRAISNAPSRRPSPPPPDPVPPCLRALGLDKWASEDEATRAYRRMAHELHPDKGGNPDQFIALREHYESARQYIRERGEVPF